MPNDDNSKESIFARINAIKEQASFKSTRILKVKEWLFYKKNSEVIVSAVKQLEEKFLRVFNNR